jgi:hypothetical protein
MMTSSMSAASTFDRSRAALMAAAPRSEALKEEKAPRNFPIGVRAAETITAELEVTRNWKLENGKWKLENEL